MGAPSSSCLASANLRSAIRQRARPPSASGWAGSSARICWNRREAVRVSPCSAASCAAASSPSPARSPPVADQPVDQGLDLALGLGAGEAGHRLAADERVDRRHRLDAQLLRQLGVLVDVDLDQPDLALGGADHLLEQRRELLARAAPGAQKSTSTGTVCDAWMTSWAKVWSEPSLMTSASPTALGAAAPPKSCIEATSLSWRSVVGREVRTAMPPALAG